MPIHFSIGFALEQSPKRAYVSACGVLVDDVQIDGQYVNVVGIDARVDSELNITATWPREESCQ